MARLGDLMSLTVQSVIALMVVLGAIFFLVKKFVVTPATRGKGPDVAVRSIVSRARQKKRSHHCE